MDYPISANEFFPIAEQSVETFDEKTRQFLHTITEVINNAYQQGYSEGLEMGGGKRE